MPHRDDTPRPSRRRWLASVGAAAAGVGALSGCSLDGGDAGTATPTATPTRTPASGALDPANYGPPGDGEWTQTMADYFEDGELDESLWTAGFGHHQGEDTWCSDDGGRTFCWARDHASVDAETNRLRLKVTDSPPPPAVQQPDGVDPGYTAGAVTTAGTFAQEFGYFEAAARIPDEPGTLPACWLMLDQFEYAWREIELYEKVGARPADELTMGGWVDVAEGREGWRGDLQQFTADGDDGHVQVPTGPVDEGFQVVGLEWRPDTLAWYVNGDEVGRIDGGLPAEYLPGRPLHWICNSAVFEPAQWIGNPLNATFPHYHEFEWIRTWQHENAEAWQAES